MPSFAHRYKKNVRECCASFSSRHMAIMRDIKSSPRMLTWMVVVMVPSLPDSTTPRSLTHPSPSQMLTQTLISMPVLSLPFLYSPLRVCLLSRFLFPVNYLAQRCLAPARVIGARWTTSFFALSSFSWEKKRMYARDYMRKTTFVICTYVRIYTIMMRHKLQNLREKFFW